MPSTQPKCIVFFDLSWRRSFLISTPSTPICQRTTVSAFYTLRLKSWPRCRPPPPPPATPPKPQMQLALDGFAAHGSDQPQGMVPAEGATNARSGPPPPLPLGEGPHAPAGWSSSRMSQAERACLKKGKNHYWMKVHTKYECLFKKAQSVSAGGCIQTYFSSPF